MDKLIEINTLEEYELAIKNRSIIMFSADWCPDCMYVKPFIGAIVDENPQFTFYIINRDNMINLCKDLNILGIPSFIAFDHKNEIGRFVSKLRKTKVEIQNFINDLN